MYRFFFKRVIDLSFALMSTILFIPIFIVIAIVIKLKQKGAIFYIQERPGYKGKIFKAYKFKTMTDKKDFNGMLLPDKDRITGIGKFIRSTSLDELPQLFNIIKGDMGIVGPRPLLPKYLGLYTEDQKRRHDVKPGLTGWAQVNGRNDISWIKKFELDVWYVDHISFLLDIKIILMTFKKVFLRVGVTKQGHLTTEAFNGYN